MLELVTTTAAALGTPLDVNARRKPRNTKWRLINRLFRLTLRLGVSNSELVKDLAHNEGDTALHNACRKGHLGQVRWLLDHGARGSLHVRTRSGLTPLAVARVFGPHPDVEAMLLAAIAEEPAPATARSVRAAVAPAPKNSQRPAPP